MKLKFMNKMIAIMCAATVATSGVVTSVGAVGDKEAIQQLTEARQQLMDNIAELEQKELENKNPNDKIDQINEEIKDLQTDINKIKEKINFSNKDRQKVIKKPNKDGQEVIKKPNEYRKEVIKKPNEYRKEVIKKQGQIAKLKQARARVNRNSIELINKKEKALKVIESQVYDVEKQYKFMEAFLALKAEISEFYNWNMSKKAGVSYTDVIVNKNIMTRCLELKNNFQAHRANAIITKIKQSIPQMRQYIKNYEEEHINKNNQENLVKDTNNETIKNSKMLGPSKRLVPLKMLGPSKRLVPLKMLGPSKRLLPQFKKMMILTKTK